MLVGVLVGVFVGVLVCVFVGVGVLVTEGQFSVATQLEPNIGIVITNIASVGVVVVLSNENETKPMSDTSGYPKLFRAVL